MLKKTMTTVDFGGTKRTETYYFNLTKAEIMEMQLTTDGGFTQMIQKVIEAKNQQELVHLFKTILCKSYGVMSPDGRKFIKNQAILDDFVATQAFSDLYMELVGDEKAAIEFFNGVLPEDIKQEETPAAPVQPGLMVAETN